MVATLNLSIIVGVFALIAPLGLINPARAAVRCRWPMNIGLGAFNVVLVRLASVAGPFAIASFAARPEAMPMPAMHISRQSNRATIHLHYHIESQFEFSPF